jgi:site-specific DNA-methyltransferase (adenine-specific)
MFRDSSSDGKFPGHPCPRKLGQVQWIVKWWAEPTDVVLDPFAGSGTTLEAAKRLGHRAIGIEIEERYCEIAVKRLAQRQLSFAQPPAPLFHEAQT